MREIKFRALDEFSNQWIHGQAFFIDSDNDQGYIANGISDHHCVKKETAGQYTGLKDKNDKEVYEGDVIKFRDILDIPAHNEVIAIVNYIPQRCALNPQEIKKNTKGGHYIYLWSDISDIEVIGNIYENKNLLKEEV